MPILEGKADEGHEALSRVPRERLFAARVGPWKAHFITQSGYGGDDLKQHTPPLLFHLERDPSEKHNVAEEQPYVIEEIQQVVRDHRARLQRGADQLEARAEEYRTFVE